MSPDHSLNESATSVPDSRYSAEETAHRGDRIYEQAIRAQVEPEYQGKVVAIDVETGAYAVSEDALSAAPHAARATAGRRGVVRTRRPPDTRPDRCRGRAG